MKFEHIIEKFKHYDIFSSSLHGDGVQTKEKVTQDSVLFNERPFQAMQTITNKHDVLACSYCLRFIGSIELQADYLKKKVTRQDVTYGTVFDQGVLPCEHGCGECYCSATCKSHHWMKSHQLLCTGLLREEEASTSPLIAFKTFALESNEIFILCGEMFASICLNIEANLKNGIVLSDAISNSLSPYEGYVRNLWWEAAVAPSGTNPKELVKTLKKLVAEGYSLLSATLKIKERGLDHILSEEYLSRTIGMFEQNNVGIRLNSPLAVIVQNLQPNENERVQHFYDLTIDILSQLNSENGDCDFEDCEGEEEDEEDDGEEVENVNKPGGKVSTSANADPVDGLLPQLSELIEDEGGFDRVFPPLDGTGFYRTICKINHSCSPNVLVKYHSSEELGLTAQVVALRDIEEGEELLQSYIDQTLPYKWRQKALEDYGFRCNCQTCVLQK